MNMEIDDGIVFHNDEKTLEIISEYWTKVKFVGD